MDLQTLEEERQANAIQAAARLTAREAADVTHLYEESWGHDTTEEDS